MPNSDQGGQIELGHDLNALGASCHNGPGWRIVLWTQGCSVRCTPQCLSPHLLEPGQGHLFTVPEITAAILQARRNAAVALEGVTILGGEPTDQAEPLAELLEAVQGEGLSVMLYSGLTLDRLASKGDTSLDRLLSHVDLLVDGPFIARNYDDRAMWRGSHNQTLIHLSERYSPADLTESWNRQGKSFSIVLSATGRLRVSGLQVDSQASRIFSAIRPDPTGRNGSFGL